MTSPEKAAELGLKFVVVVSGQYSGFLRNLYYSTLKNAEVVARSINNDEYYGERWIATVKKVN